MRTLTLSECGPNSWSAMLDGKIIDELCVDEVLAVVAMVLLNGDRPKYNGGFLSVADLQRQAVARGWPKPDKPDNVIIDAIVEPS